MRLKPGYTLRDGLYTLQEYLGGGGQADVWRARKKTALGVQLDVALKLYTPDHAGLKEREQQRRFFLEEAQLTEYLRQSEHFIKVRDAFELPESSSLGLELELIEGVTFATLQEDYVEQYRKRLPWFLCGSLAYQALMGLSHAHNAQDGDKPLLLVHRDIKPANLMLSTQGIVKILDLGLAKWDQRDQALNTAPGFLRLSYGYAAPEQVTGQPLSPQTDLFALGVVMFEMFTGRGLFGDVHDPRYLVKIAGLAQEPPPSPSSLAPEIPTLISELVLAMLSFSPQMRPQSALEAAEALAQALKQHQAFLSPNEIALWWQEHFGRSSRPRSRTAWYGIPVQSAPSPTPHKEHAPIVAVEDALTLEALEPFSVAPRTVEEAAFSSPPPAPQKQQISFPEHNATLGEKASPALSRGSFFFGLLGGLFFLALGWWMLRAPQRTNFSSRSPVDAGLLARPVLSRGKEIPVVQSQTPEKTPSTTEPIALALDAGHEDRIPEERPPLRRKMLRTKKHLRKRRIFRRLVPRRILPKRIAPPLRREPHVPPRRIATHTPQKPPLQATLLLRSSLPCKLYLQQKPLQDEMLSHFRLTLHPGTHRFLCLNRRKRFVWEFSVRLHPGETKSLEKREGWGTLFVESAPWSTISIRHVGPVGDSLRRLRLHQGEYMISLFKKGDPKEHRTFRISIRDGQETRKELLWSRKD